MNTRSRFAVLGVLAIGSVSMQLHAQDAASNYDRAGRASVAIDLNGVRHNAADYKGGIPPWMREASTGRVFYPYEARRLHQEGVVVVRCSLDPNTGRIVNMSVIKSSGFPILDEGARKTFASWKWPPGKWKEVEIPIDFAMPKGPGPEKPRPGHKPAT